MTWQEAAFETGPAPTIVYGPELEPVAVNAAYRALFGLESEAGPGRGLRDLIHPGDRETTRIASDLFRRGEPHPAAIEIQVRAADRAWRSVLMTATGLPGRSEVVVTLTDVTAQREAEAARAREARYVQALLERSADIVTVLEADGSWRSSTPQGSWVLGYPRGYDPPGGIWSLLHPDDREPAAEAFAAVIEGRPGAGGPVDLRLATTGGTYRWFEVVAVNLLEDPVVSGVVVTARDATERHETRAALAASEVRYQDLVARMQEGLWVIDADAVTTFANPRMAEMLGTTSEEMLGSHLFDWVPEAWRAEVIDRLAARRHGVAETHELVFRRADGSDLHALVSATPTMRNGVMVEAFAAVTDISRLKAAEAELEAALTRALASDRAKSVFLSHVSHELRTPLNGVLGYAGILKQTAADPAVVEFAAGIEFAGRHLLRLIEDLLHMTRLETGELTMRLEPVPLTEAVSEASTLAAIPPDRLEVDVAGHAVMADATRFRQVLVNLLANAAMHGPPNGTVSVCARLSDGRVRVAVCDQGPGVAAADAERIFEPFVRLDGEPARGHAGTGLGLPISRSLAEAMDGSLSYRPGPPSGFVVDLPAAVPVGPVAPDPGPRPCHIVAVEDDPTSRRVLEIILGTFQDCTYATTTTLAAARRLVEASDPALLILDVRLPDGDGLGLLGELRSRPETADLPAIVLTADTNPEVRDRALDLGAAAFLTKPYEVAALSTAIRSAVARGAAWALASDRL